MKAKIVHITAVDLSLRFLLYNQLRYLLRQGLTVDAISSPGRYVQDLEQAGIHHIPVPISRSLVSPVQDLISLARLVGVLRREEYDIVHTHTPKASFLGQVAARLAGAPHIVRTLHGFYFQEGTRPLLRRLMITLESVAARSTALILSQNSEDITTAVREGICSADRIQYLGNGIDLNRFDPARIDPLKRADLLREFDLDPGSPVVGFVGRLVAEKGVRDLLEAARIVQAQVPGVQFLFAGHVDREKRDAITPAAAEELGLGGICRFVGFQEDMPTVYSLMDLFTLPSHREGFPRSAMEASAMGLPLIASDIRGCREVVEQDGNGLLVPPLDPAALGKAIVELLKDLEQARRMASRSREIARERFDERKVFEKVLKAYRDLLEGG